MLFFKPVSYVDMTLCQNKCVDLMSAIITFIEYDIVDINTVNVAI